MSIQYAGGVITFENAWAQSSGTKTELCNRIYADFLASGWSSIAVTGTAPNVTAFTVQSAATSGGSLACQVKADTSGTNCVHFVMQTTAGTNVQTGGFYLLPAASKVWYMVFNKFQFFIWQKGSPAGRDVVMGGVFYLPTFLQSVITTGIWGMGNGTGDTAGTGRTFRDQLGLTNGTNQPGNLYININGTWWEDTNNSTLVYNSNYGPRILVLTNPSGNTITSNTLSDCRFYDGSYIVMDSLFSVNLTTAAPEAFIVGQLFDSFVTNDVNPGDTVVSYDTHNYIAFTNFNSRSTPSNLPGTLWIATT